MKMLFLGNIKRQKLYRPYYFIIYIACYNYNILSLAFVSSKAYSRKFYLGVFMFCGFHGSLCKWNERIIYRYTNNDSKKKLYVVHDLHKLHI